MEHRGIFDSGCSGHMTGNRAHLEDYQELSKVGSVTFGGSKGSISGKGTIRLGNLVFDDVAFVKELGIHNVHPKVKSFGDPNTPVRLEASQESLRLYIEPRKVTMPLEDGLWVEVMPRSNCCSSSFNKYGFLVDFLPTGAKLTIAQKFDLVNVKAANHSQGDQVASLTKDGKLLIFVFVHVFRVYSKVLSSQCCQGGSLSTSRKPNLGIDGNSTTGGQVVVVHNKLLDYGFNFMNTQYQIDNESTIAIGNIWGLEKSEARSTCGMERKFAICSTMWVSNSKPTESAGYTEIVDSSEYQNCVMLTHSTIHNLGLDFSCHEFWQNATAFSNTIADGFSTTYMQTIVTIDFTFTEGYLGGNYLLAELRD
ncbi:hypothetical protein Tco_0603022 [Tanacetum coccineum]